MTPVAVLVVPAKGDPGGLLAYGRRMPVGAQGPTTLTAHVSATFAARPPSVTAWGPESALWPSALPLWWDNALVPEGWDRLNRAIDKGAWTTHPSVTAVLRMAEEAVSDGLASRVVVLARDASGRLVEVQP